MVKCQVCGEEAGDNEFCPNCGYKIPIKTGEKLDNTNFEEFTYRHNKKCPYCGAKLYVNAVVCPNCGSMLGSSNSIKSRNSTIAIILSFLIPGLGQLYYGFYKTGLTFFLLTFSGIPLLLFLIFVFFFILNYFIFGIILVICLSIIELLIWLYNVYDMIKSVDAIENGEYVEDKIFKFIF